MTQPNAAWRDIRHSERTFAQVYLNHVPFLALIPTTAAFIGFTQVGWSVGSEAVHTMAVSSAAALCAIAYLGMLVGVFLFGEFINWMACSYGVTDSDSKSHYEGTALAVYVTTPLFLAGAIHLYPMLWLNVGVFLLAGCYAVYLIYEGVPILMDIPKEQGFMYSSSIITVGLVLMVATAAASVIVWTLGIQPVFN